MGVGNSRPFTEIEDAFRKSVLLVHAPESLFFTSLAAGPWSVMRNVHVDIVRWDGQPLSADQYRHAVARHHTVLYFVDPCDSRGVDASQRMSSVLAPVVASTAATKAIIHVVQYTLPRNKDDIDPRRHLRPDYRQVIRSAFSVPGKDGRAKADDETLKRIRLHKVHTPEDWGAVQIAVSWDVLPRKLGRPLSNLARDLALSCGASDVLLLDAFSLLPVIAHVTPATEGETEQQRVLELLSPLYDLLLMGSESACQRVCEMKLTLPFGELTLGWAVPKVSFCVVVIPFSDDSPPIGPALVDINIAHYAAHFTNVARNTTERSNFTPILPP